MVFRETTKDGVTRLTGASSGAQGPPGNTGQQGPVGTRWGETSYWVYGTAENIPVAFPDGDPPRVGDLVVGNNSVEIGQVSIVTAVVDATHADLANTYNGAHYPTLRGPAGPSGVAADAWPVGSTYFSDNNTNPSAHFGGTWVRFAEGQFILGVQDSNAARDEPLVTGGEETVTLTTGQMPSHHHNASSLSTGNGGSHDHFIGVTTNSGTGGNVVRGQVNGAAGYTTLNGPIENEGVHSHNVVGDTGDTGGGGAHNNMPPFITLYIWRRIA